ncbi:hypothetical protein D3C79_478810 [compost metagenome]
MHHRATTQPDVSAFIFGGGHLRGNGSHPDELVQSLYLRICDRISTVLDMAWTYCFMRLLCVSSIVKAFWHRGEQPGQPLLLLKGLDPLPDLCNGLIGQVLRVRPVVGDHACFKQLLCQAHGLVSTVAELGTGYLLHERSGQWWRRGTLIGLRTHADNVITCVTVQRLPDLIDHRLISPNDLALRGLLLIDIRRRCFFRGVVRAELETSGTGKCPVIPVRSPLGLVGDEIRAQQVMWGRGEVADLQLSPDDDEQCHGLHATGRQRNSGTLIQCLADRVTHQAIQNNPALLCRHHFHIDISGIGNRSP